MTPTPINDLGAQCAEVDEMVSCGCDGIGLFVHRQRYYWLVQEHKHFQQDVLRQYLELQRDGQTGDEFTAQDLENALVERRAQRSGFPVLTDENFIKFLEVHRPMLITTRAARQLFLYGLEDVDARLSAMRAYERAVSIDEELTEEQDELLSRARYKLPMFYVNFHLKEFYHCHNYVSYESAVSPDWIGRQKNFLWMIPQDQRWWVIDGVDYGVLIDGISVG